MMPFIGRASEVFFGTRRQNAHGKPSQDDKAGDKFQDFHKTTGFSFFFAQYHRGTPPGATDNE
jgi:hypothetical protein